MSQVLKLTPIARLVQFVCKQIGREWRAKQAVQVVAKPDSDFAKLN